MDCFYGLVTPDQAIEYVVAVCDVLGHGENGKAVQLMLETAAQETHLGRYRDPTPAGAGRGLFQCDEVGFIDVVQRMRPADAAAIRQRWGVHIELIEWRHLDFSPLLAAIFCRMKYRLRPEIIPASLEGRAAYWKWFYNTARGKGTEREYITNALRWCERVEVDHAVE